MKLTVSFMRCLSSDLQPLLIWAYVVMLGMTPFSLDRIGHFFLADDASVAMVTRGLVDEGRCGKVPLFTRNAAVTGELVDNDLQG